MHTFCTQLLSILHTKLYYINFTQLYGSYVLLFTTVSPKFPRPSWGDTCWNLCSGPVLLRPCHWTTQLPSVSQWHCRPWWRRRQSQEVWAHHNWHEGTMYALYHDKEESFQTPVHQPVNREFTYPRLALLCDEVYSLGPGSPPWDCEIICYNNMLAKEGLTHNNKWSREGRH